MQRFVTQDDRVQVTQNLRVQVISEKIFKSTGKNYPEEKVQRCPCVKSLLWLIMVIFFFFFLGQAKHI